MADMAGITDFVKQPAYPDIKAKPKVTKAPPSSSKRPGPASVAAVATKAKKPPDPMEMARRVKAMAPMISSLAGK